MVSLSPSSTQRCSFVRDQNTPVKLRWELELFCLAGEGRFENCHYTQYQHCFTSRFVLFHNAWRMPTENITPTPTARTLQLYQKQEWGKNSWHLNDPLCKQSLWTCAEFSMWWVPPTQPLNRKFPSSHRNREISVPFFTDREIWARGWTGGPWEAKRWSLNVLQSPESAKYLSTFKGNGQMYRVKIQKEITGLFFQQSQWGRHCTCSFPGNSGKPKRISPKQD